MLGVYYAVHWLVYSVSIALNKYLETQNICTLELATFEIIVQGGFQPNRELVDM